MSLSRAALLIALAALSGCASINDVTTECRPYGGVRRHVRAMTMSPRDQLGNYIDGGISDKDSVIPVLPFLALVNTVRLVDMALCIPCDTFWLPVTLSDSSSKKEKTPAQHGGAGADFPATRPMATPEAPPD